MPRHLIGPPRPHALSSLLVFLATFIILFLLPLIKIRSKTCTPSFSPLPPPTFFNTDNGLIVFASPLRNDTTTKHPIEALIANARREWDSTLDRQSKSLPMAVKEYQRRHNGRLPPKGFEKWWQFVIDNKVGLVDEYDQISQDLEPFWAIQPQSLRKLVDDLEMTAPSRRLIFQVDSSGLIHRTGSLADSSRARELASLMESYQKYNLNATAGFKMVISAEDQAEITTTWREKSTLLELARRGEFITEEENLKLSQTNLPSARCPPNSAPRDIGKGYSAFIYDHLKSMDVCSNLEYVPLHGALMNRNNLGFRVTTPLFAFSKTSLNSDIRVTPLEQYHSTYKGPVYDWNDPRRIDKAFWRGSLTGTYYGDKNPKWKTSHRVRLHQITRPTNKFQLLVDGTDANLTQANSEWFDIELVGGPIQCEPLICDELRKLIQFHEWVGPEHANLYKYVLDVDGNGWSGRFHKLLSSNRVVIKNTIFPEWYADRIQPWYHYIPVQTDYSDLHDIVHFLKERDDLAAQIAQNAREYSQRYWRKEDMAAYMFRLSLEWSRLYNRQICVPGLKSPCDSYDMDLRQIS